MRVVITGGAGFIGSHLAERLLAAGHTVCVLDDLSTGQRENLARIDGEPGLEFVEGSILDVPLVERLVGGAECVFHLAAAVGVKLIMEQPSRSILTNVTGTENVLQAAIPGSVRTFIASTSEVYGKSIKFPFSEGDDLTLGATHNLRWSYACSKMLDEFLALSFARDSGLPVTVMRFFNTTGPRQTGRYGMVVPSFIDAALAGRTLKVHGDGQQSRCFGHVADVVEALVRLMDAPTGGGPTASGPAVCGEVFNIGNDQEITIMALAEQVIAATGSGSAIELVPYSEIYPPGFEDMARRKPDLTKLQAATGFRPRRMLEEIIADIIAEKRGAEAMPASPGQSAA